jgi:hypothetical protein
MNRKPPAREVGAPPIFHITFWGARHLQAASLRSLEIAAEVAMQSSEPVNL